MKKLLAIALAFALAALPFCAVAETASATLEGLITETDVGYFILNDIHQGSVRINWDATTVYEGTASKASLAAGQYVYVQYNGIMTKSLPPQVSAKKVSCFEVKGTVTSILGSGFIVEGDATLDKVVVHSDASMPPVFKDMAITLYYNGIMALSQPPQISAVHIVVPMLSGTVSAVSKDGFTLTAADGSVYSITLSADTALAALPANGETLLVYYNGKLDKGKAAALVVTAVTTDGTAANTATD